MADQFTARPLQSRNKTGQHSNTRANIHA